MKGRLTKPGLAPACATVVTVVLAVTGCASAPSPVPTGAAETVTVPAAPSPDPSPPSQSLYRLTHDSGGGRTGLKVVLRESGDERFQVTLSDLAGRRVLSLDHSAGRVVLVDHREESYCVTGPDLTLSEVHPEELPLSAIPRVLAGRFPVAGADWRAGDDGQFTDESGRRWRVERDGDGLASWALLDDEGPALWWSRDDEGGILSRRGGEQYRWRLVVREETSHSLADLVPEGYVEGTCDA